MSDSSGRNDLVVLVADKDMEQATMGLLPRYQALETREFGFQIFAHPSKDGGCRTQGITFLRNFCRQFDHALLMFDREGSGGESESAEQIERQLEEDLRRNGWEDRAAVIVIDPELETWIWSASKEVDQVAGWGNRIPSLREWLVGESYLNDRTSKPARPKEAFRHALRHVRKPPSSSLFNALGRRVSFKSCQDRSFKKLQSKLKEWYPKS